MSHYEISTTKLTRHDPPPLTCTILYHCKGSPVPPACPIVPTGRWAVMTGSAAPRVRVAGRVWRLGWVGVSLLQSGGVVTNILIYTPSPPSRHEGFLAERGGRREGAQGKAKMCCSYFRLLLLPLLPLLVAVTCGRMHGLARVWLHDLRANAPYMILQQGSTPIAVVFKGCIGAAATTSTEPRCLVPTFPGHYAPACACTRFAGMG